MQGWGGKPKRAIQLKQGDELSLVTCVRFPASAQSSRHLAWAPALYISNSNRQLETKRSGRSSGEAGCCFNNIIILQLPRWEKDLAEETIASSVPNIFVRQAYCYEQSYENLMSSQLGQYTKHYMDQLNVDHPEGL